MTKEVIILVLIWLISIISFIFLIPRQKWAIAIFSLLMCQTFTWVNALIHLNLGLISYPFREFPTATDLSITIDYIFYPLICAFYILYEPLTGLAIRMLYLSLWISILTLFDALIEQYTDLLNYIHYAWYWSWIDFFIIFFIVSFINKWFFGVRKYD